MGTTGFTAAQLYSTASYQSGALSQAECQVRQIVPREADPVRIAGEHNKDHHPFAGNVKSVELWTELRSQVQHHPAEKRRAIGPEGIRACLKARQTVRVSSGVRKGLLLPDGVLRRIGTRKRLYGLCTAL